MIFKYTVGESEQIFEYEFEGFDDSPYEELLEEIAQDYCDNHDGSEDDWPITLKLFDSDNEFLGEGKIEVEYEPTYYTFFKKVKNNENI